MCLVELAYIMLQTCGEDQSIQLEFCCSPEGFPLLVSELYSRFPGENAGLARTGPKAEGDERVSMMRELPARALNSTLMFTLQEEKREWCGQTARKRKPGLGRLARRVSVERENL